MIAVRVAVAVAVVAIAVALGVVQVQGLRSDDSPGHCGGSPLAGSHIDC